SLGCFSCWERPGLATPIAGVQAHELPSVPGRDAPRCPGWLRQRPLYRAPADEPEGRTVMATVTRSRAAAMAVLAVIALSACSASPTTSATGTSAGMRPESIVPAPKSILSAAQPESNGTMWALAGSAASRGLFEFNLPGGQVVGRVPVSNAAQAVAQSLTGTIGLALATRNTGALELLDGSTAKVIQTVPLAA